MAFTSDDKEYLQMLMAPIKQDMCLCKDQLTKINGRINKHDEQISEALIERAKNREHQSDVEENVKVLKVKTAKIEDELMEYQFFRKYPKSLFYLTGIVSLLLVYEVLDKFLF